MEGLKTNEYETKNKRSVWTVTTKPYSEAHFATYPHDLIIPCIKAGCPEKVCVDCGVSYKRITSRKSDPLRVNNSTLDRFGTGKAGVHRKIGGQYQKWLNENPLATDRDWETRFGLFTSMTVEGRKMLNGGTKEGVIEMTTWHLKCEIDGTLDDYSRVINSGVVGGKL